MMVNGQALRMCPARYRFRQPGDRSPVTEDDVREAVDEAVKRKKNSAGNAV
ncbi:hypothetical protein FDG2_0564 [Candidatus Protofrankia californiensis]|uniref:Uncharacterized protein n=1 Tax=Candidatus Protofrankia californiensis TaxID=1839754 RepID=A0A1C3NTV7_9ACTN|nr:hypothetical protein FDG2_0564 [Candidatus Protofrankia californiensis]